MCRFGIWEAFGFQFILFIFFFSQSIRRWNSVNVYSIDGLKPLISDSFDVKIYCTLQTNCYLLKLKIPDSLQFPRKSRESANSHLKSDAWPKPSIQKWATNSFRHRDANLLMSVVMLLVSIVYNFWQCIHSFGRRIIVYSLNCWLWIFVCNLNREGGEMWVQY